MIANVPLVLEEHSNVDWKLGWQRLDGLALAKNGAVVGVLFHELDFSDPFIVGFNSNFKWHPPNEGVWTGLT